MRVFGVDPGSRQTGFGVIQINSGEPKYCSDPEYLSHGTVATVGCGLPQTLKQIFDQLSSKLIEYKPQAVAVESLFFAKNARSALVLGHARGAVLLAAEQLQIPIFEYSPSSVKASVTGAGHADKEQVQKMVRLLLGVHSQLSFDESDALAIALCHAQQLNTSNLIQQAHARLH